MNRSIIFYICAALIGLSIFNSYCKGKATTTKWWEKDSIGVKWIEKDTVPIKFDTFRVFPESIDSLPTWEDTFALIEQSPASSYEKFKLFVIADSTGEVASYSNGKLIITDCERSIKVLLDLNKALREEKDSLYKELNERKYIPEGMKYAFQN